MLMEVALGKPVYAVDTAQNGRLVAVGGAGSTMLLNFVSWVSPTQLNKFMPELCIGVRVEGRAGDPSYSPSTQVYWQKAAGWLKEYST